MFINMGSFIYLRTSKHFETNTSGRCSVTSRANGSFFSKIQFIIRTAPVLLGKLQRRNIKYELYLQLKKIFVIFKYHIILFI